jgi:hypothetical protein
MYAIFIDRSAHLENLFFFLVVNNELCNKTASFITVMKCLLSKNFTPVVILVLLWRGNIVNSFLLSPSSDAIYSIIKQSEGRGSG